LMLLDPMTNMVSPQGFTTGGMGSDRHFAWQQPSGSNVRFVPKADKADAR